MSLLLPEYSRVYVGNFFMDVELEGSNMKFDTMVLIKPQTRTKKWYEKFSYCLYKAENITSAIITNILYPKGLDIIHSALKFLLSFNSVPTNEGLKMSLLRRLMIKLLLHKTPLVGLVKAA